MASRFDIIEGQSRDVVNDKPWATSQLWQAQPLTSQPSAYPRTYGMAFDIWGLPTEKRMTEQYDSDRNTSVLVTVQSFRVSNHQIALAVGWQLVDPQGLYWNVLGIESSGPGTTKWQIGRDNAVLATPDRKTGR
jgi:hypothetical protein